MSRPARGSYAMAFTVKSRRRAASATDSIDVNLRLVVDGKERRVREPRQAQRVAVMPRLLKEHPKAPLLLHFGENDTLIPPEDVQKHRLALPDALHQPRRVRGLCLHA